MKFIYEIFPIILFFLTFKFYDIYAATYVGIFSTMLQVAITRLGFKKWDRVQLFTMATFIILGIIQALYLYNNHSDRTG